jgi:hypothetical protein
MEIHNSVNLFDIVKSYRFADITIPVHWLLQITKHMKQYILQYVYHATQSQIAGTANLYPSITGPINNDR